MYGLVVSVCGCGCDDCVVEVYTLADVEVVRAGSETGGESGA